MKAGRRSQTKYRIKVALIVVVLAVSLVWVVDNAIGFVQSPHEQLMVRGDRTVQLASGKAERVDCWKTGAVQEVWRAAAPADRAVPYRCGDTALSIVAAGPISTPVLAVSVLSLMLLVVAVARRRRTNFWY